MKTHKLCKKCNIEKLVNNFPKNRKTCKECASILNKERNKKYQLENKEKISKQKKEYYSKNTKSIIEKTKLYREKLNKDDIKEYNKKYQLENKEKIKMQQKIYQIENKEEILKYKNEYRINNKEIINKQQKNRRIENPEIRARSNISSLINKYLKKNNSSKNNRSCLQYLSYTIKELKDHLEAQFEPWMTWQNYGLYSAKIWDDNNPATWTWQLDHIIPQSDLPYSSMESDNFKKSWALENLRPYSAKQNLLDGVKRIRHK
jgi:hypothetical protein